MDLPSFTQFSAAGLELVGYIRAGSLAANRKQALTDGWICFGYAINFVPGPETPPIVFNAMLFSDEGFCEALEAKCNAPDAVMEAGGGLFWLSLLLKLLQIIGPLLG